MVRGNHQRTSLSSCRNQPPNGPRPRRPAKPPYSRRGFMQQEMQSVMDTHGEKLLKGRKQFA